MNVKEAEEIVAKGNPPFVNDRFKYFQAVGILECHELYKPLVEVLEWVAEHSCLYIEEMNNPCEKCLYCKSKASLRYYRTKIMGEK